MPTNTPVLAHADDGDVQTVAAELRVLIAPAMCGGFVAQGIEIDYVATGTTEDEAREHFAAGFIATIRSYMKRGRSMAGLFKSNVPAEARQAYFAQSTRPIFRCAVAEAFGALPLDATVPRSIAFIRSSTALHA